MCLVSRVSFSANYFSYVFFSFLLLVLLHISISLLGTVTGELA